MTKRGPLRGSKKGRIPGGHYAAQRAATESLLSRMAAEVDAIRAARGGKVKGGKDDGS